SFGVAVSCAVCPAVTLAVAGLTVTDATAALAGATVTAAAPIMLSLIAVTVAAPAAAPVTSPLAFTVATAALSVDHDTTRPVSAFPLPSRGVAVSCTDDRGLRTADRRRDRPGRPADRRRATVSSQRQ